MKELSFNCPHCEQHIECAASYAGTEINCPTCQNPFTVPPFARAPIPRWFAPALIMLAGICLLIFPRVSHRFLTFLLPPAAEDFNRLFAFFTAAALVALWGLFSLIWSFAPKGEWRKTKLALQLMAITVLAGSAVFIIRWKFKLRAEEEARQQAFIRELNPEKFEDAWQTHERWSQEANAVVLRECSNYVGFSRILDHFVFADNAVTNWSGEATIDFVNRSGGIERTNLLFNFFIMDHHCIGGIDENAMYKRDQESEARMAAILRGSQ
jgi:hypothetical protein